MVCKSMMEVYDGPIKNFLYRDDSNLADNLRYGFKGWSGTNYGDITVVNPEYIDITTYRVTWTSCSISSLCY